MGCLLWPRCSSPATESFDRGCAGRKASCKNKQASWKQCLNQSLKIVSSQIRKRRLAVWAVQARSGLQGHGSPATGSLDRSCAGGKPAATTSKLDSGSARKQAKSRFEASFSSLVSLGSDVWQCGLLAPGPFRPSGPGCFSPATGSFDRSVQEQEQQEE